MYGTGKNANLKMVTEAWLRMEKIVPNIGKRPNIEVVQIPKTAPKSQVWMCLTTAAQQPNQSHCLTLFLRICNVIVGLHSLFNDIHTCLSVRVSITFQC